MKPFLLILVLGILTGCATKPLSPTVRPISGPAIGAQDQFAHP